MVSCNFLADGVIRELLCLKFGILEVILVNLLRMFFLVSE